LPGAGKKRTGGERVREEERRKKPFRFGWGVMRAGAQAERGVEMKPLTAAGGIAGHRAGGVGEGHF